MMLILGVALSVPAWLLSAYAPADGVLIAARILGGVAAGMAYPTTLAVITALWSRPARTRPIALWAGLGSAVAALGPLIAGALALSFRWGSSRLCMRLERQRGFIGIILPESWLALWVLSS
jgi:MFS transporter, DHA2 family, multidrug resistance protein